MSPFTDHIRHFYKEERIPFFEGTLAEAQTEAQVGVKYLLVYLHSPQNYNTKPFLKNVLASDAVVAQLSDDASVLIGMSVLEHEGRDLANAMHVTAFPAIIVFFKNRVLMKLQGEIEKPEEFLVEWQLCRERWDGAMAEEISFRAEKERREREIRESVEREEELERKDRELLARLAAEREEKNKAAEEKRKAEAAAKAEAEKQQRLEEERKKSVEAARRSVPPEPPATADANTIVQLSVRSLSGVSHVRRFLREEPVELLLRWARSLEDDDPTSELSFVTGFPPKALSWTTGMTFGEMKELCPRAAVIIRKAS
ncbi:UBX domain containing protein, putative [Angomonas deanei]|uniref:UBX domain containing protein, putative n=1 Tax=Angomonas deanei TaxID=59799 RepID=A0A7G2CD36_9TRYP|nr:UBX domain containing protein, putative [Angomonas deanei]